jgi:hypothetical protein
MMALYTERVQTVITRKQYEMLTQLAEQEQKPLSVLLREAIEQTYFTEIDRQRRRQALKDILALNAPVADWEQMEEEIERGMAE